MDFIDWAEVESRFDLPDEDEDDSTPLKDLILPERKYDYEDFLPNLQAFSLSATSFKGSWDRLIDTFNLVFLHLIALSYACFCLRFYFSRSKWQALAWYASF